MCNDLLDVITSELSKRDFSAMTLDEIAQTVQIYSNIMTQIELHETIAAAHRSMETRPNGIAGIGMLPFLASMSGAPHKEECV